MALTSSQIQSVYVAFFNRPADHFGLVFWENPANATTLQPIMDLFAASAEYTSLFTGLSSAAAIDKIYMNLFGRHAELAGLDYWVPLLDSHQLTLSNIAFSVSQGALTTDLIAFQDKTAAAVLFTDHMDTSAEVTAYAGTAALAVAKAYIASVTDDASLATAVTGVDTTILAMVAAGTPPPVGLIFPLTTGADLAASFTGGAGNDTFNAADIAGAATWTTGDAINGGGGTNTFNVITAGAITIPVSATVTNIQTANLTSGGTIVANTSGWTGLTALNTTSVGGAGVTAAATTAVNATNTGAGVVTLTGGLSQTVNTVLGVTLSGSVGAISTTSTALAGGAVAVDGGSTVGVTTTTAATGSTVVVGATTAATGAVTVNTTTSMVEAALATTIAAGTAVTVTGGTTITVNNTLTNTGGSDNAGDSVTGGNVLVTGSASTTTVSVTQTAAAAEKLATTGHAAFVDGTVTINDVNKGTTTADTITTVTLNGYGASTIDSSALTTLNLGSTGGTLALNMSTVDTAEATTLTLTVAGGAALGAISGTHAADLTTVNLVTTGTTASTIADLTFASATTLAVSGTSALTLTANTLGAALTTVTSGAGGLTMGGALGTGVLFTGGTGADSIILTAGFTKAITMGDGNDTVTYALQGAGGSVDAGVGFVDTIVMTGAQAVTASADSVFNSKFINFDALTITAGGAAAINLAALDNVSTVNASGQTGVTALSSFVSGGTINLTGANPGGDVQAIITNANLNPADVVNFHLTNSTAATVAFGTITAASVETINISTVDTGTGANVAATIDTATLVATGATNVVVSGNNGLTLTNVGNTAITTFDAHGVVADGTTDAPANLGVTFLSATIAGAVSITGGAGNDTLTGVSTGVDTINGGAGNDTMVGGAGADVLTGGEGIDTITGAAGNDSIILTETTAAADTYILSTAATNGIDTITGFMAGSATNHDVTQLLGTDTTAGAGAIAFGTSTNTTLTSGSTAFVMTGANTATGHIAEINATLSSFGNLGLGGVVDGTELLKGLSATNVAASAITATTAFGDKGYIVAYQGGNAYLYHFVDANTNGAIVNTEIALVGVYNGVTAGAFVAADFTAV